MELLIDTADLNDIQDCAEHLPLSGVTCNPSIVKKSAPKDFFEHMNKIRGIIGMERSFHIQIIAEDFEGQMKEAHEIFDAVDDEVYIKVPVNWVVLKTIQALKQEGHHVTATAVYDLMQAYMAMTAGADYIAPYVNRIGNIGGDPNELISKLSSRIDHDGCNCKIVAASFHSIQQVKDSLNAGAQAVTVSPDLYRSILANTNIAKAVDDFRSDWESIYGKGAGISGK